MAILSMPSPDAVAEDASTLAVMLAERVNRRGWHFRTSPLGVTGHRPEWPAQLFALLAPRDDGPALLGLAVELGSMPLQGERFRDIFNADREATLRGYGGFTVRQLTAGGSWLRAIPGRAFCHGVNDGISRRASVVVFDRDDVSGDVIDSFAAVSQRLVETGSEMAALLQRLYQRTVLATSSTVVTLPETVAAARPRLAEDDLLYPWRR